MWLKLDQTQCICSKKNHKIHLPIDACLLQRTHLRMTEVYSINDFWIKNVRKMSPIGNIRQLSDILDKFVIKM